MSKPTIDEIRALVKSLKIPEPGFYYHYKHKKEDGVFAYAYEVYGTGLHTEVDDRAEAVMVKYRPLYPEAVTYQLGKFDDFRPLSEFNKPVSDEKIPFHGARFVRITDPELIEKMRGQKHRMYGE